MRTPTGSPTRQPWTDDDDALLEAILTLREAWRRRRGHLTLAALDLDPGLVTVELSGLCPRHGQFVREWTGRVTDPPPFEARCQLGESGRCGETVTVFVIVSRRGSAAGSR